MLDKIASRADYDRQRTTQRMECPEFFNFGLDVVNRHARERPDALAMHWVSGNTERRISFSEFAQRSNRLASGLIQSGLPAGSRVLVVLPRVVEWWETLVGLMKGEFVSLPGTTLLTSKDIAYRAKMAETTAIITDVEGAEKVDRVLADIPGLAHRVVVGGPARDGWLSYEDLVQRGTVDHQFPATRSDDPALIYFTSGTTGMPKMVLHTHASYGLGHAATGRYWLDLNPDDLHWNISDTGWAKAAWSSLFAPWFCGSALFVQHSTGKFEPAEVLKYLEKYPITTMCSAPTIYRYLVQLELDKFRPRALRHCVAAGEPLNPEVIETWKRATGLTVRDGYGQTETVLLCGNFPGVEVRFGSMGLPTPGIDLAVVDENGKRLATGEEGDVAVSTDPNRPLGLFREYWKNPTENAKSYRNGWYYTGDRATIDDDGYFWFVGRGDDVITSAAYRIGPFEVESALIEHAAVVEAAVVGKPDAVRGQIVKAYVVLAKGIDGTDELKRELQEHVKQSTAPYKYPREIEFVPDLPKTTSGKIRRVELRQRAAAEHSPKS